MKEFEFVCGGARSDRVGTDVRRMALDTRGNGQNIRLEISDVSRSMLSTIPAVLLDALEVAAYVYCADQHGPRGSTKLSEAGASWRRALRFTIPVRCPDIWSRQAVKDALTETLDFLSDDWFEFEFVPATAPLAQPSEYFPSLVSKVQPPDEIALFSGGLDSLAGAIETMASRKRAVLVGHHSSETMFSVQKQLVWHLNHTDRLTRAQFVPVRVTNADVRPKETSQRTRSFLFATLAFVLARMFGKDSFTFFENGVVSFNLSIAGDVLGGRATRTTHPRAIRGFEAIFSLLAECPVTIRSPLLWSTKKEIVQHVVRAGLAQLLPHSVSCAHLRVGTRQVRHCGVCSQCIDRRFAVLAAGAGEFEPASNYAVDLLVGARERDEDAQMATAYVKLCQTVNGADRSTFLRQFPDVSSSTGEIPGLSAREAEDRIWQLHREHAENVIAVIEKGFSENAEGLARRSLPARSLLSLCVSRERIEPAPAIDIADQIAAFLDQLPAPVCEFAIDEKNRRLWLKGGWFVQGAGFNLIEDLLKDHRRAKAECSEVAFTKASDLADALDIELQSLRQLVKRTRDDMAAELAVKQGIVLSRGPIETGGQGKGYRLSPHIREVRLGDLTHGGNAMSQADS